VANNEIIGKSKKWHRRMKSMNINGAVCGGNGCVNDNVINMAKYQSAMKANLANLAMQYQQ